MGLKFSARCVLMNLITYFIVSLVIFPMRKVLSNKKNDRSSNITKVLKKRITERNRLERLASKWPITYNNRENAGINLQQFSEQQKNIYYEEQL